MAVRAPSLADYLEATPIYVVWEITLACDLRCRHCGSRAGQARDAELSTPEALDVIAQLAAMGTREITFIGGEAYLRDDWTALIRGASDAGIVVGIQTGGRNLDAERVAAAIDAGVDHIGVSVDGLAPLHDRIRGRDSWERAIASIRRVAEAGLDVSVNTAIGEPSLDDLEPLVDLLAEAGASSWRPSLVVAMGNAVDHPELLLQPFQMLDLMPILDRLIDRCEERGIRLVPGNNIGYFGPYEHRLHRGEAYGAHWSGCAAGHLGLGIEADGTVKACPSLATTSFAGGNVREASLASLWSESAPLRFARDRTQGDLSGLCRDCYYADACRAGCTWTSHSSLGDAGDNPWCHWRALKLQEQGWRERVERSLLAPRQPFATGRFRLLREPISGMTQVDPPQLGPNLACQPPSTAGSALPPPHTPHGARVPPNLRLCGACRHFFWRPESACPHCGVACDAPESTWLDDQTLQGLIAKVRASPRRSG